MGALSPARLRFGRDARLKRNRDFRRLRLEGERRTFGCLVANWQRLPPGSPSRLGVVTAAR
ncbi:MAG TPA: hypothetical protein VN829_17675, partial [Dongiaceae bacterium]|nr:hypothetical protein [Dongiaceae bacterium]